MQFSPQEKSLILQTLQQRCDWLSKKLTNMPEGESRQKVESVQQQLAAIVGKFDSTAGAEPTSATPSSPAEVRVLIVDDDEDLTELLATLLEGLGFSSIDVVHDGQSAIKSMYEKHLPYHLILSDWNMPIKSGLEVHAAMQASDRYKDSVFVMTTSVTQASQIREAIERGVSDYLAKPISAETLERKFKRLFPGMI
ncbi:response regulator [Gilvimarinus chinensis]|uniref:response regulator n=1 Tax=Gilvimarinus chinensis TaxID=396005 RepID=UPI00037D8502|nr:response regulator [Gilvimarinus chinensis]